MQERGGVILWGAHGVDMFFVISGFIIVTMMQDRSITVQQFALDRITRIVPMYWIGTTLALGLSAVGISIYHSSGSYVQFLASLFFILFRNNFGLVQPILFLGRTLNNEMLFYAAFSIVLKTRRYTTLKLTVILTILSLIGFLLRPTNAVVSVFTNPLLLEFVAGAWIGGSVRQKP